MFTDWYETDEYVVIVCADGYELQLPKDSGSGVSLNISEIGEFSASFNGTIIRKAVDLKVSVYYSTSSNLTLYNYQNGVMLNSFSGNSFTLKVDNLYSNTTYYYFTEIVNNGRTYYSQVSSFTTKKVTGYDDAFAIDSAVSLDGNGTANSYIVSQAGTYSFSAVKGNSSTSVGSVASMEVLWESCGTSTAPTRTSLVSGARYSGGKVYVKIPSPFVEGNAVVAAKNSSGTILWSWHIWLTDAPEEQVYYGNAGTVMDRNLGATSATPGDVGALGLLYQWGRKDPFLGSSSISMPVLAKSTISWPLMKEAESCGTVDYAIKNPTTYIAITGMNDWMAVEDQTLWQTDKTIYDPCPPGWHVPEAGEYGLWADAYGSYRIYSNPFDKTNRGINFSGYFSSESTVWYPAAGYYSRGTLWATGDDGTWSGCNPGSPGLTSSLVFTFDVDDTYIYMPVNGSHHAAVSVRCLKE